MVKAKVTNFNYQIVPEGVRLSCTYSELNEDGDIVSSNNRTSNLVQDEDVLNHLHEVKTFLENKLNGTI